MYRLGRPAVGHAGLPVHSCAVACQVPPLLLSITMPAAKPLPLGKLGLHGPHHAAATYCVPPTVTASSAVTWEAAFPPSAARTSKMFFQSVAAPYQMAGVGAVHVDRRDKPRIGVRRRD